MRSAILWKFGIRLRDMEVAAADMYTNKTNTHTHTYTLDTTEQPDYMEFAYAERHWRDARRTGLVYH